MKALERHPPAHEVSEALTSTPAAQPVAFARTFGLFTPPSIIPAETAVLFLSPWGLEEMRTRKVWRHLAEELSSYGIASMRFDYPGTGDSLDGADVSGGVGIWEEAVVQAAAELRRRSGTMRLVLVGHGIGATLAVTMAGKLGEVAGAALLAPVVNGRMYLREISVWSKMVDEGLGLRENQRSQANVSIAGLAMSDRLASDLKGIDLRRIDNSPAANILVLERAGRENEEALSGRLASLGADVRRETYTSYDELVASSVISRVPLGEMQAVVDWVRSIAGSSTARRPSPEAPGAAMLSGDVFTEEALRFATGERLLGVLCLPIGKIRGAPVVILGTAHDRHAGWARSSVETARFLARHGIASLRFDGAGIADSPSVQGSPEVEFYADRPIEDVQAALDLLERRGFGAAVLSGRCSGAYLAFQAALAESRVCGAIIINPFTFQWDDQEPIEQSWQAKPRSLDDYKRRALSLRTLGRVINGEVNILSAAGNIGIQLVRRLTMSGPAYLAGSRLGQLRKTVHAQFQQLTERKLPISLIYSDADVGLDRFRFFFGMEGRGLRSYPNVKLEVLPDVDHNLSPPEAISAVRERILSLALAAEKTA